MNCSEIQALLSEFYDGELADEQLSSLLEHLDGCSDCAKELTAFEKLSKMASSLSTPHPPADIWNQLEQQLHQEPSEEKPVAKPVAKGLRWSFATPRLIALVATIFIAVGIGWFAYQEQSPHHKPDEFAAEFGHYLEKFRNDPHAAQQLLLVNYENHRVDPNLAIQRVGYRPAVADGLPDEYTLESTHVVKMPCCTCVQSLCKRRDGSTLAIFEHDDEETTKWFSGRPEITATCNNKQCCLVELDERIAASWRRGRRHITLIGVRDVAEVGRMVAWLDK